MCKCVCVKLLLCACLSNGPIQCCHNIYSVTYSQNVPLRNNGLAAFREMQRLNIYKFGWKIKQMIHNERHSCRIVKPKVVDGAGLRTSIFSLKYIATHNVKLYIGCQVRTAAHTQTLKVKLTSIKPSSTHTHTRKIIGPRHTIEFVSFVIRVTIAVGGRSSTHNEPGRTWIVFITPGTLFNSHPKRCKITCVIMYCATL